MVLSRGHLYDDPRAPTKNQDESDFISRVVGQFSKGDTDKDDEGPSLKTNNEDMERLM